MSGNSLRDQYVEIRQEMPKNKYQQDRPEYKTCRYITEAIISEGTEKGELRKVCAHPDCPVHHPKKKAKKVQADAAFNAVQEKRRREEALAQATGLRWRSSSGSTASASRKTARQIFSVDTLIWPGLFA